MGVRLQDAIETVRKFFAQQCGDLPLTCWQVLDASEDMAKGVYVIHCAEHGFMEAIRFHVVWVDLKSGEIVHTHRVAPEPKKP